MPRLVIDVADIGRDRGATGVRQPEVADEAGGTDRRPLGIDQQRVDNGRLGWGGGVVGVVAVDDQITADVGVLRFSADHGGV